MYSFFFCNDTAPTEIYTLSLHDALPICYCVAGLSKSSRLRTDKDPRLRWKRARGPARRARGGRPPGEVDRKSTRLNSSHSSISYAVFCLKKKNRHPSPRIKDAQPPKQRT